MYRNSVRTRRQKARDLSVKEPAFYFGCGCYYCVGDKIHERGGRSAILAEEEMRDFLKDMWGHSLIGEAFPWHGKD